MGSWGTGIFENDTAMDFLGGLASHPETTGNQLREALETAAHMQEQLDAGEGAEALAAAAIVSACSDGTPIDRGDPAVEDYLRAVCRHVPPGLELLAAEAVERVMGAESELARYWLAEGMVVEARAEPEAVRRHLETV